MIKLDQVSTWNLTIDPSIKKTLLEQQITNYQMLKDLLKNNPEFVSLKLINKLTEVESCIERCNKKGKQPQIYTTLGYEDVKLNQMDTIVTGVDLPLRNPTTEYSVIYHSLRYLTIAQIKDLLSHVDSHGNNALLQLREISSKNITTIVSAIVLYEEQIIRQAAETSRRDINLFAFQQEEKRKLVTESLNDIITYFLENTSEEFIWGNFTEPQTEILNSALSGKKKRDRITRENLTSIITNYTTLSELEDDVVKTKTLNRFIKNKFNYITEGRF